MRKTVADIPGASFSKKKKNQSIKAAWFREFGRYCQLCGREMTLRKANGKVQRNYATIDHIIPKDFGGTNAYTNLQVICHECNHRKANLLETDLVVPPP